MTSPVSIDSIYLGVDAIAISTIASIEEKSSS
jgi:hypothetical protein